MKILSFLEKNGVVSVFHTLFHMLFTSWIVFFVIELKYKGFVSNYFNVHLLLIMSGVLAIVFIFIHRVDHHDQERKHQK